MEEFIKNLPSPSWRMGVFIVGIVINLASAYLKIPIDKILTHTSSAWRIRRTKSLEKREALIELLKDIRKHILWFRENEILLSNFNGELGCYPRIFRLFDEDKVTLLEAYQYCADHDLSTST